MDPTLFRDAVICCVISCLTVISGTGWERDVKRLGKGVVTRALSVVGSSPASSRDEERGKEMKKIRPFLRHPITKLGDAWCLVLQAETDTEGDME